MLDAQMEPRAFANVNQVKESFGAVADSLVDVTEVGCIGLLVGQAMNESRDKVHAKQVQQLVRP